MRLPARSSLTACCLIPKIIRCSSYGVGEYLGPLGKPRRLCGVGCVGCLQACAFPQHKRAWLRPCTMDVNTSTLAVHHLNAA